MGINKRTKHIQLRFLWIQDLHQSGQLILRRVSTENNPADAFTKPLAAAPSATTSFSSWYPNRCCQRSGGIQQHLLCR